jgi:hypothetical protein
MPRVIGHITPYLHHTNIYSSGQGKDGQGRQKDGQGWQLANLGETRLVQIGREVFQHSKTVPCVANIIKMQNLRETGLVAWVADKPHLGVTGWLSLNKVQCALPLSLTEDMPRNFCIR